MSNFRDSGRSNVGTQTNVHRVQHDWSDSEPLYYTIARAVAAITDTHPTKVEPVDDVVDPDALDRLFEPAAGDYRKGGGHVGFVLEGCNVTVYWDGEIIIESPV